jgi:hypothetical protein
VPDLKPKSGSRGDVNVEQGSAQLQAMPLHQKHPPPTLNLEVQKGQERRHKEVQTETIESWDETQTEVGNVVQGPKTVSDCNMNSPQEEQELREDWSEDKRQEEFTIMIQRLNEMDAIVSNLASSKAIDPAYDLQQPPPFSSSAMIMTLPPQTPPPDMNSGDGNDVSQRTAKGGSNGFHQAPALDPPISARASPSDHPTAPEVTRENRNVEAHTEVGSFCDPGDHGLQADAARVILGVFKAYLARFTVCVRARVYVRACECVFAHAHVHVAFSSVAPSARLSLSLARARARSLALSHFQASHCLTCFRTGMHKQLLQEHRVHRHRRHKQKQQRQSLYRLPHQVTYTRYEFCFITVHY